MKWNLSFVVNLRQRHREAYMKVIKEKVSLRIRPVRFNNVGLPRSGKTSFRRRIMGEILNILAAIARGEKEQASTGVAESGGQVFIRNKTSADIGTISSKVWSVFGDLEEEAGMLGQVLYETVYGNTSATSSEGKSSVDETTGSSKPPKRKGIASLRQSLFKPFSSLTKSSSQHAEPKDAEIEEMLGVINKAMDAEDWDKVKYLLDDMVLLINTDTGGQAEFLELHSSLVQGPSFNLLFSRLVDDLESQFEVYYTNEEGESTVKEDSIMTMEEVLFQCLASIAGYCGNFCGDDDNTPGITGSKTGTKIPGQPNTKVIFVGTYRDKVSQEEFEKKDKLLQKKIKSTLFYEKGIVEFASKDNLMLAVDNMNGGQDEIDRIRKVLEGIIEKSFEKITIPASWLVLSLQIRSKKLRTMSLEKCEELARKVGISPSELQHALWFLHHRVGVILYYPELPALKGTVICDIQVVFDSATNLIKNTFTFDRVGQRVSERFKEKAQFSLKDVKTATSEHTDTLIPLVQLFEYLGILTAIPPTPPSQGSSPQEPTYFMPCVLKSARASELQVHGCSDSDPVPLMLRYDCGYMPVGIFPSMIVNLVSQKLGGWKMIEKGIRKNRVQFLVGEDCDTVTLISRPRYFEIVISRSEGFQTPTASLCSHIRGVIQSILSIVTSRMNYHFSMGYKFGFECPAHPGREHLCVLAHENARRIECLQDQQKTFPLQAPHQMWFPSARGCEAVPLSVKTLALLKWMDERGRKQAFHLVDKVGSKWMKFGLRIGLDMDLLKAWEMQFQGDASRCWLEVMETQFNPATTLDTEY